MSVSTLMMSRFSKVTRKSDGLASFSSSDVLLLRNVDSGTVAEDEAVLRVFVPVCVSFGVLSVVVVVVVVVLGAALG